jgi:hypothetical protein
VLKNQILSGGFIWKYKSISKEISDLKSKDISKETSDPDSRDN